jgi:pimeloyl-ACP methyl ester carboxylesterase
MSVRDLSRRDVLVRSAQLASAAGLISAAAEAAPPAADTKSSTAITPFTLAIPERDLDDLKRRLETTRWPEREAVDDWSQGAPLARVQALVAYWKDRYDWRRCEAMLNGFGQYRTPIDGLNIHFIHARSKHEKALPLLLTHGWPGSVIEFHKVIRPLTDPTAFGGKAEDAFHVIAPSLPGYGFSDKPAATGWDLVHIARAWAVLMERLGYTRYVAQGGDWGAAVTSHMGQQRPAGLAAIHLNMPLVLPSAPAAPPPTPPTAAEQAARARMANAGSGYARIQATRPQTLGYALADSPSGQAGWIYEKYAEWSDSKRNPESVLSMDEMLDNIMLYWLPGNGASSGRLYWESFDKLFAVDHIETPVGCSIFPGEVLKVQRAAAERVYKNLFYWNEVERGGHFAAFEQPEIFVRELRSCFRMQRT